MKTHDIINTLKTVLKSNFNFIEDEVFQKSPYNADFRQKELEKNTPRLSAILILIYPKENDLHSVLMLRSEYDGKHSGQISFPGGKKEHHETLEETALREFFEEMGVHIPYENLIGKMTDVYIPPSNFLISPYVAFSTKTPTFSPNEREVAQLIEFPIRILLQDNIIQIKNNLPYFNICEQFVWGATALILNELQYLLRKIPQE